MAGQTYVEVGLQPLTPPGGSTKTFRLRNVVGVLASVARLFWELQCAALLEWHASRRCASPTMIRSFRHADTFTAHP
jgi:hypothetical protein